MPEFSFAALLKALPSGVQALLSISVFFCGYALTKIPSFWIGHHHRRLLARQYRRAEHEGLLLVSAWRSGDRAAAIRHLALIHSIEHTLRFQYSLPCRLALAAWAFFWSIALLMLLRASAIHGGILTDGDALILPIMSFDAVAICFVALAGMCAWHDLVVRTLLPSGAGYSGDTWASAISNRLEAERVFDLQAKANAEEVVRYRERQEAEARARAEQEAERRRREEAKRYERFWQEQEEAKRYADAPVDALKGYRDLLKVQADYTLDDINAARRAAALKLHPDKSQKVTPRTRSRREAQLKLVNHAYDVLKKRVT